MVMMTIVVTELAETIGQLSGDKLWREMFWVRFFFFLSWLACTNELLMCITHLSLDYGFTYCAVSRLVWGFRLAQTTRGFVRPFTIWLALITYFPSVEVGDINKGAPEGKTEKLRGSFVTHPRAGNEWIRGISPH